MLVVLSLPSLSNLIKGIALNTVYAIIYLKHYIDK